MMKRMVSIVLLIMFVFILSGCGETFRGVKEDSKRIGSGFKKIFVSGE